MTIDEAITDLSTQLLEMKQQLGKDRLHFPQYSYQVSAIKLGIEALKREKEQRDLCIPGWITPLPGETEEA